MKQHYKFGDKEYAIHEVSQKVAQVYETSLEPDLVKRDWEFEKGYVVIVMIHGRGKVAAVLAVKIKKE